MSELLEIIENFDNINNNIQTTSINCFQNTEITENQKLLNITLFFFSSLPYFFYLI